MTFSNPPTVTKPVAAPRFGLPGMSGGSNLASVLAEKNKRRSALYGNNEVCVLKR